MQNKNPTMNLGIFHMLLNNILKGNIKLYFHTNKSTFLIREQLIRGINDIPPSPFLENCNLNLCFVRQQKCKLVKANPFRLNF